MVLLFPLRPCFSHPPVPGGAHVFRLSPCLCPPHFDIEFSPLNTLPEKTRRPYLTCPAFQGHHLNKERPRLRLALTRVVCPHAITPCFPALGIFVLIPALRFNTNYSRQPSLFAAAPPPKIPRREDNLQIAAASPFPLSITFTLDVTRIFDDATIMNNPANVAVREQRRRSTPFDIEQMNILKALTAAEYSRRQFVLNFAASKDTQLLVPGQKADAIKEAEEWAVSYLNENGYSTVNSDFFKYTVDERLWTALGGCFLHPFHLSILTMNLQLVPNSTSPLLLCAVPSTPPLPPSTTTLPAMQRPVL